MANFTALFEFVLGSVAAGSLAIVLGVLLGSVKRGT
jgi:ABC-type nitrate/sulfonate/bicarbonate transport system permease component